MNGNIVTSYIALSIIFIFILTILVTGGIIFIRNLINNTKEQKYQERRKRFKVVK